MAQMRPACALHRSSFAPPQESLPSTCAFLTPPPSPPQAPEDVGIILAFQRFSGYTPGLVKQEPGAEGGDVQAGTGRGRGRGRGRIGRPPTSGRGRGGRPAGSGRGGWKQQAEASGLLARSRALLQRMVPGEDVSAAAAAAAAGAGAGGGGPSNAPPAAGSRRLPAAVVAANAALTVAAKGDPVAAAAVRPEWRSADPIEYRAMNYAASHCMRLRDWDVVK